MAYDVGTWSYIIWTKQLSNNQGIQGMSFEQKYIMAEVP